jgi:hypothetical protein
MLINHNLELALRLIHETNIAYSDHAVHNLSSFNIKNSNSEMREFMAEEGTTSKAGRERHETNRIQSASGFVCPSLCAKSSPCIE